MSVGAPDGERERALLDERTALLARRGLAQARGEARHAYLVCAVGAERYGLPLAQVAAVLPDKPCTALPGAPAGLRGIVALSGGIVSVVDLGAALGLAGTSEAEPGGGHLVRLRMQEPPVALAVARVLGVARIDASNMTAGMTANMAAPDAPRPDDLGADAVSGYAPPGSDATGSIGEGFSLIDLPRLLRRFMP